MKLSSRSLPVLMTALLVLALAGCGKSPEQSLQDGKAFLDKHDYTAAILELKTALQEQPNNREARLLLGEVFIKNGAYQEAEKELSKARSLGVTDDQIIPMLAKVYVRMGEPQKALDLGMPATNPSPPLLAALHTFRAEAQLSLGMRAEAEESIGAANQADAKQPELLLTRAKIALIDRQKEQAGQLIDAALQQDAKYTEALYLKAELLNSENKPEDAVKVYRQIVVNDPSQFRAHLAIAGLQMKKGEIDAADKTIQAAEKVAGQVPMVKYARGALELQRGKLDQASSALLDVLNVMPDHLPSALAYAVASFGLGNYEQSIKHASLVLSAAPDNHTAAKIIAGNILASSQLKIGDVKGALNTLTPLLRKHADDAKLLALAGEAYLQSRDYTKAQGYLDKAAALDPENAQIKARQAAGHMALGESAEALADLEKATRLSDKPGQADMTLVMMHLKGKEYDSALQAIANLEKKLPNNPVTHNLRASALLGKQDRAGARKALEQALALQPKFFPAAVNLARMDMEDKKPEAARQRFETILKEDKTNVGAMLALADLAAAEKKEKDYVEWLEKAIKANPTALTALTAHAALVRHYLAKKDHNKALRQARQAVSANPDNLEAISLLGGTQMVTGDHSAAIDSFSRVCLKVPRLPEAHLRLATALIADKQWAPARAALQQALKLKPDMLQAQDALMRLELADNKPDTALGIARQIQAQQPGSPIGFDHEADIHLSQKHYPQAIKAYEQSLAKGAGTAGMMKLHRALFMADDTKAADQRLAAWLKQNPKDMQARAYAAEIYLHGKRNQEAIALYEELHKASPNNALVLNNLANLYQAQKDPRALSTAEQAHKYAPDQHSVLDTLGWILVEQGQLPRAIELLGKAAAKAPKIGLYRYHYGVALAKAGKKAEARKELEAAIASGQQFSELEDARTLLKSL
jgi:putative PEP-CTERM system TPR-repeat lipoprotein